MDKIFHRKHKKFIHKIEACDGREYPLKKMVIFIFLIVTSTSLFAQTQVNGVQSGTWTVANSPYLVIGEIIVPTGQTLTIEAGIEINFQGHYKFTVHGNLQAIGTETDSIFFTTSTPAIGWGGVRFDGYGEISNLSFCRIEYGKTAGEYPDNHGGAIALIGSDAVFSNCVFADNEAVANDSGMGGAVYASGTGSTAGPLTIFSECRFIRNHAYGEGGAIKFTGDYNTEIITCEFFNNNCLYGGGAISFYLVTDTKLIYSVFADNYTMYSNGGAFNTLGMGNTITAQNCTISGNSAVTGDGGAINIAYGTANFVNCIVYDNPGMYSDDVNLDYGGYADINYCDLTMPNGATGSNNIDENPQFVDAANLDFHLMETSPCIDAGDPSSPPDPDGTVADMGAFYYHQGMSIENGEFQTENFQLFNYPNPFYSYTVINFSLPANNSKNPKLEIYNLTSQKVKTLVGDQPDAGQYSVIWNGKDDSNKPVPSGVYFYKLKAGSFKKIGKMILVKE